jgi:hypothetical protein
VKDQRRSRQDLRAAAQRTCAPHAEQPQREADPVERSRAVVAHPWSHVSCMRGSGGGAPCVEPVQELRDARMLGCRARVRATIARPKAHRPTAGSSHAESVRPGPAAGPRGGDKPYQLVRAPSPDRSESTKARNSGEYDESRVRLKRRDRIGLSITTPHRKLLSMVSIELVRRSPAHQWNRRIG